MPALELTIRRQESAPAQEQMREVPEHCLRVQKAIAPVVGFATAGLPTQAVLRVVQFLHHLLQEARHFESQKLGWLACPEEGPQRMARYPVASRLPASPAVVL